MNITNLQGSVTLSNGINMPYFGLGVFQSQNGFEVINAVKNAIAQDYKLIDTAAVYKNEAGVGKAIKESGKNRGDIFITSKVWNADQGYDSTLRAFQKSLDLLDMDYLDLYLIHWPVKGKYLETWKALEKLYSDKKVKAIGVSNFSQNQLKELINSSEVVPMVNQVEFHPRLVQESLLQFCNSNNIYLQAWAPLMQGKVFSIDTLNVLADKYNKSIAQIVLRWNLQKGVLTIPKSVNIDRIIANAEIFNFSLSNNDMELIDSLNMNERLGPDPEKFNF